MIRKYIFALIFLSIAKLCFSEEISNKYYSEFAYFYFENGKYEFFNIDEISGEVKKSNGNVKFSEDTYGNYQMNLSNWLSNEEKTMRYLKFEDYLIVYNNSESPLFFGSCISSNRLELLISAEVEATSFLTEKTRSYSPKKLTYWGNLNYVWAEGAKGQGIGEKLFIRKKAIRKLYILPGYVSVKNPTLFYKNSRPKELKIQTQDKVFYFSLVDKPIFQVFNFENQIDSEITIEILDVYPGTKYEDTCISSILCSR